MSGIWLRQAAWWLVLALVAVVFLRQRVPAQAEARGAAPGPPTVTPRGELTEAERVTIRIFRNASPSVVSVVNRALLRDFWTLQVFEVPRGAGSGFVWDKDGHIISNYHVIYQGDNFQVTFSDGSNYVAEVVGQDPDHDIALLRVKGVPPEKLVPLPVGTSKDLQVGQRVLAIGNPFGLDTSLSAGIVSSLGRNIQSMTGRTIYDVIQTDAAINPGNSGGPLLDSAGRLIGINTAIVSPSGGSAGIGFAVPVDTVTRVVPQLIAYGRVKRAGLGVVMLPDAYAERYGIEGVAVMQVVPRSGADRAGLQGMRRRPDGDVELGDVIVGIDAEAVKTKEDLLRVLERHTEGDRVELTYWRGEKKQKATVVLQSIE
ncbi:MAG: trypsin-like peptidase domain-containing protein [Kiritimatiellae bacterium]|nr:trypsin-like peptidase domain-containing protein [Kiritimatiellia bacterium]